MDYFRLTHKKEILDAKRPLPPEALKNLDEWLNVELTYSSNAIEGNTLTRAETAVVLEKGITVGGKPLKDHLEAVNHLNALHEMRKLINQKETTLENILFLHSLILKGIDDDNAGRVRTVPVRISGAHVILPNPAKVPVLLNDFITWINKDEETHPVEKAALAHYKLVTIHPFTDGNGRTARLLMNLILLREGYPLVIIPPRDRLKYIRFLEQAQMGGSLTPYLNFIVKRVDHSFDLYMKAFVEDSQSSSYELSEEQLIRIGALSEKSQVSIPTIRHWTKNGLLTVATTTPSGYQLYSTEMIERIKKIRDLQAKRHTIEEIYLILNE